VSNSADFAIVVWNSIYCAFERPLSTEDNGFRRLEGVYLFSTDPLQDGGFRSKTWVFDDAPRTSSYPDLAGKDGPGWRQTGRLGGTRPIVRYSGPRTAAEQRVRQAHKREPAARRRLGCLRQTVLAGRNLRRSPDFCSPPRRD